MIEVAKFRLIAEIQPEEFSERNAHFQQHYAYQQDGLLRRTVASGLDGEWIAITWWRSMNDARRSATEALTSSVAIDFTSMMEPSSVVTDFFKELPG